MQHEQDLRCQIATLRQRWEHLNQKLSELEHNQEITPLSEERLDVGRVIAEIQAERQQVQQQLHDLEIQLLTKMVSGPEDRFEIQDRVAQTVVQEAAPRAPGPALKDIAFIYLLSSFLLVVFGALLQELHLISGLIITELVFVAAPVLLYSIYHGYHVPRTFYLAHIRLKTVLIVIVTTMAAFVLVGVIAIFQELVLPRSLDYQEVWLEVFRKFHQIPFVATFLLLSVLPGVCEELFFRGFLLRGIRRRFSDWFAILLTGFLFGVFHFDPYRLLPTMLLGIIFGYMVVKTGSIFTGMTAHITNNTIALLISYVVYTVGESDIPLPSQPPETLPVWQLIVSLLPIVAIALAVFIAGLRALPRAAADYS